MLRIDYKALQPYKFLIVSPTSSYLWVTVALSYDSADRLCALHCKDNYYRAGILHGFYFIDNTPLESMPEIEDKIIVLYPKEHRTIKLLKVC
jgi:hypothetical protein